VLVKRRVCGDTMVAVRMIVPDSHESLGLCSAVISARLVNTCSVIFQTWHAYKSSRRIFRIWPKVSQISHITGSGLSKNR